MMYIRVVSNGARSALVKFLTNETVPIIDKERYLLGAYIYINNITTLVTQYNEWLDICKKYPRQTLWIKERKHQRMPDISWETPLDMDIQFLNEIPSEPREWYYISKSADVTELLHPSDSLSIANKLLGRNNYV